VTAVAGHRHEIPTHLGVEDKAYFGLSVRQVMVLTIGGSAAYALWNQWPDATMALRIGLAAATVLLSAILALVRPNGRGLEEWAFAALHYAAIPKMTVYRPQEPRIEGRRHLAAGWAEITPDLQWEEDEQ
jgi:hypothetical protein